MRVAMLYSEGRYLLLSDVASRTFVISRSVVEGSNRFLLVILDTGPLMTEERKAKRRRVESADEVVETALSLAVKQITQRLDQVHMERMGQVPAIQKMIAKVVRSHFAAGV